MNNPRGEEIGNFTKNFVLSILFAACTYIYVIGCDQSDLSLQAQTVCGPQCSQLL